MKKVFLFFAVATFTLVSCKKERTCTCTSTTAGYSQTATTTIKDTKKNAKESCEKMSSTSSSLAGTVTTKCELK